VTARSLPSEVARVVREGDVAKYGGEVHRAVMAVVAAAVECEWSVVAIEELFAETTELGARARVQWADGFGDELAKAYHKACLWQAENVDAIAEYIEAADEIGYGRSRVARQCLLALLWLWHRGGQKRDEADNPIVTASLRLLSELTLASLSTVHRAANMLCDRGIASPHHEGEAHGIAGAERRARSSSRWTLAPLTSLASRMHNNENNNLARTRVRAESVVSEIVHGRETHHASSGVRLHSVWSESGLGANAQRTYAAMCSLGPCKVSQLAEATRLHRNTLSRGSRGVLQRLQLYGLCDRKPNGLWVALEADLDGIAEELGVSDRGAQLHERYEACRNAFDAWHHAHLGGGVVADLRSPARRAQTLANPLPRLRSAPSARVRAAGPVRLLTDDEIEARIAALLSARGAEERKDEHPCVPG
jgi:hypothetical protein